jgi:hypothetical protein
VVTQGNWFGKLITRICLLEYSHTDYERQVKDSEQLMSMTLSINIAGTFSTILDPARQEQCNRNVMNMSTTKGVWKSSEICGLLKI